MAAVLSMTRRVMRYNCAEYSDRFWKGSGYCEDQWSEQRLEAEVRIFGRVVYRYVVDVEIIPEHVVVALAAFGETYGWRSKFADMPNVTFSKRGEL